MAWSLIQELRGYISGTQRIEGFNKQEIQEILDYICTEYNIDLNLNVN